MADRGVNDFEAAQRLPGRSDRRSAPQPGSGCLSRPAPARALRRCTTSWSNPRTEDQRHLRSNYSKELSELAKGRLTCALLVARIRVSTSSTKQLRDVGER